MVAPRLRSRSYSKKKVKTPGGDAVPAVSFSSVFHAQGRTR
jgi:ribosomal protein L34E